MRYEPHAYFVAPARETAELWRTVFGVVVTFFAGLALYQVVFSLVASTIGPAAMQALTDAATFDTDTPFSALYTLITFGFFGIGLALVVRGLHGRSPATLFGGWEATVSDFLRVALSVGALFVFVGLVVPQDYELARNPSLARGAWLALLPLSLTALLIQSGTEELFFRGYLQQQVAARFPGTPLWMILPSVLFGLAHFSPEAAGPNAVFFVLWAAAFGLAAADLTARTGAIGAALGFHMANNVVAILFTSLEGPGSGLALYHLPIAMDDPAISSMMLPELATIFCGWLAARLALKV